MRHQCDDTQRLMPRQTVLLLEYRDDMHFDDQPLVLPENEVFPPLLYQLDQDGEILRGRALVITCLVPEADEVILRFDGLAKQLVEMVRLRKAEETVGYIAHERFRRQLIESFRRTVPAADPLSDTGQDTRPRESIETYGGSKDSTIGLLDIVPVDRQELLV